MEGLHSGVQQVADLGLSNFSPLGAAWCGYSIIIIFGRQQRECKQADRRRHKTFRIVGISLPSPWSRVFLEKLTVTQLVETFQAFYGNRRIITASTRAGHLSLS
jgi:hypothetical protein